MPDRNFTKEGYFCDIQMSSRRSLSREGGRHASRLGILFRRGTDFERARPSAQGERTGGCTRRMGAKREAFAGAGRREAPVLRTIELEARRHLLAGRP